MPIKESTVMAVSASFFHGFLFMFGYFKLNIILSFVMEDTVESSIILTNYSGLVMATLMFIVPE